MIAILVAALLTVGQEKPDAIDRLISELKKPSAPRQELARVALRAYGGAVVDRLKQAKADLGFVDAGKEEENKKVVDKLKTLRVTIDVQDTSLVTMSQFLSEFSGLKIEVDRQGVPNADTLMISFKVRDIVMDGALRLMLGPRQLRYVVRGGVVVVTGIDAPEQIAPRWPVRLMGDAPAAPRLVEGLASDTIDEREKAIDGLRRLGFAAEFALWEALDSADAETHGRVADLLRELYTPEPVADVAAVERALKAKTLSCKFERANPLDVMASISESSEVSFLLDARRKPPEAPLRLQVKNQTADQVLAALARETLLGYVLIDDWVFLTHAPARVVGTRPYGPVWAEPEAARKIEDLIARLSSEDADGRRAADEALLGTDQTILGPLLQGSRILPAAAAERCRAARQRYIDEKGLWLPDEPAGAERQSLLDEQRALLQAPIDVRAIDISLDDVLRKAGISATVKAKVDLRYHLWTKGMKTGALLKALTGPYGLDFVLEGKTVVIDTAANVRDRLK
jgi:hypothetical protein